MSLYRYRKTVAAALTAAMVAMGAFGGSISALAVETMGTASVTGDTSTDWWHGFVNEDGSTFTYIEKGTEVSKFQNMDGDIDWQAAKADGLDFVMIRIAYGTTMDPYAYVNIQGAQAAGIKVGVYLCSTAQNLEDTKAETELTLQMLQGITLQYPVAYDVEVNKMLEGGATADDMTAMINYYCQAMTQAGYIPIVYANKTWLTKHMNLPQIPYDVWYASYPSDKVYRPVYGAATTIWQSSEKGTVNGIKGYVTTEFSVKPYGGSNGVAHGNIFETAATAAGTPEVTEAAGTTTGPQVPVVGESTGASVSVTIPPTGGATASTGETLAAGGIASTTGETTAAGGMTSTTGETTAAGGITSTTGETTAASATDTTTGFNGNEITADGPVRGTEAFENNVMGSTETPVANENYAVQIVEAVETAQG
ncbi:Glycosyl hydrolases family 25 [Oribacterium sp. KHPX15]|uniref:GH25 family lysozyme n=1 Tax=Oribacterium sp. KHPX15 TaxID=1855342 RepID=UPI00089B384B|nr:GH25 family lysozyme [Oribacterium sp. KHPX15]SEA36551.1 Glycosyl hydrolases family 25 [Oribacterium sp. KHPX15]